MSELTELRQEVMAYYHKSILDFYSGILKTFDIPHMHFNDIKNPKLIMHDDTPIYIGHIEIDDEGVSNFIHDTPLTIGCADSCEVISMQDFIIQGRLPSLSTIRQVDNKTEEVHFYAYQTINGQKSEQQEIFPLLRAQSTQTSYHLREHLNHLLNSEAKQIEIQLTEYPDEFKWIQDNEARFSDVCKRLEIALFKTPEQIILTQYITTDIIHL
ncbi:MAG: hypothetical protein GY694_13205 [Gammaproteobacteria bacterium]|nr:hypothetical protein [Gammaproteobacteria bacterium]